MMRWLAVASVLCAAALVFGPGLHAPFVFDDVTAIADNVNLRRWSTAFDPPSDTSLSGRPFVHASFALNYALGGLAPAGYRAVNVGLHLLNALLVFALLRRVLARPEPPTWVRARAAGISTASAVLWTLHPLQTEAVAYVTQRTELVASAVILGVLHLAMFAMERPSDRRYALAASLLCALGTGCKETIIVAPALVLCLDRAFYSPSFGAALRRHRLLHLGQLLGLVPLFAQMLVQPRDQSAGFGLGVTAIENLAFQGRAIAWYLRLSVWPDLLTVTYNWPIRGALDRYWPSALAIASLFAATIWLSFRRRRSALIGWFFFITLAPSSSVVPIVTEMVAERRMYLPLLSVVIATVLAATCALEAAGRPSVWRLAAAVVAALAFTYVWRGQARVHDYRSTEALFASALRVAPDNPQAMWALANAYEVRGDVARARALYERMAAHPYPYIGPASWGTRGLMAEADLLARRGDGDAAAATLRRALMHDPASAVGRLQRAADLAGTGDGARARAELQALLGQPYLHDRVHLELGLLQLRIGDAAGARQHFDDALRVTRDRRALEERIATSLRVPSP